MIGFSQSTATGSHSFRITDHGYTKLNWYTKYSFKLESYVERGGNVWLNFQDYGVSFENAKYQYNGKTYAPSDLGLSRWNDSEHNVYILLDVTIYYKGAVVRSLESFQLTPQPFKVGSFNINPQKNTSTIMLGNQLINYDDFRIADLTVSFGEWRGASVVQSNVLQKIQEKERSNNKKGNYTGAISINSPSSNSTQSGKPSN